MILEDIIKKILKEATSDSSGSRGSFVPPLQPGMRDFDKSKLAPFTQPLSNYKSPLVAYDSYDHDWDLRSDQIRNLERTARKISNFIKKHPGATNSDEDGNVLNRTPSGKENSKKLEFVPVKHQKGKSKINEISSTTTSGEYNGPQELGLRKWKKSELGAFDIESDNPANNIFKKKTTRKNVYKVVGGWEPQQGKFEVPTYDVDGEHESQLSKGQLTNDPIEWYRPLKKKTNTKKDQIKKQRIKEDLAVWFGKKKKPKGSSQPKGPWVDICRKVDGKHPPCGRSDASEGSYPKCRATGVAGKMSDTEKRNACQQKRRAEKNDSQSGKGQKPIMTSHKKKTNESMKRRIITLTENDLTRIVRRVLNEQTDPPIIDSGQTINLGCKQTSIVIGQNNKPFLKIGRDYFVDGDLELHSIVLQPESFSDLGRKISDPYGTGFKTIYGDKTGLKFYVTESSRASLPPGFEPTIYDSATSEHDFLLTPLSNDISSLLSSKLNSNIEDGDRIIIETVNGSIYGLCTIKENKPNNSFLDELITKWDLNNDII